MAFFYFDTNDKAKQTSRSLLLSIALSLSARSNNYLSIEKLYEKYDKLYTPTEDDLLELLMELLQGFKQAYIVIDALDECDEYHQLVELINVIHGWELLHCHFLLSSRREQDILIAIKGCITAEICLSEELVGNDIISYIHAAVGKQYRLARWGNTVIECVKETLINGANGMYVNPSISLCGSR